MRFFKRNNNLSQTVKLSDAQLFYIRINLFVFYIFYNVSLDNILELFLYFNTKTFKYSWKDLGTVETDKGEIWISGVIITYSDVKKRNFGTKFRLLQYRNTEIICDHILKIYKCKVIWWNKVEKSISKWFQKYMTAIQPK